jgi:propionyl-CoA carboxylase alpha chain
MPPERAAFRHGHGTLDVSYRRQRDGTFAVGVSGPGDETAQLTVSAEAGEGGWIGLTGGGQAHRRHVFRHGQQVWVQGPDGDVALLAVPRFPQAGREPVAGGLAAPMPGTVLAVHVRPGDAVTAGQPLLIVEAMKMEHRVSAPRAGVVSEVHAAPGDQVAAGDILAILSEQPQGTEDK